MRAWVIEQKDAPAELRDIGDEFLMPGDTTVRVQFSSVNYKDALALLGRPGVARTWPLIPGIDLVGTVESSDSGRWRVGDRVLLNGAGAGERHHGGLAERARVDGAELVRVPESLGPSRAAAIGTAGFTAMLAVLAIERHGVRPGDGPVLVTGAAGGVGSVAVAVLARLGHEVVASTGRAGTEAAYLARLGASAIVDRSELSGPGKPLQSQRWAAAVDAVGSYTLANILATLRYGGIVAACGLAQGSDLPATVMPFILRGVTLAGINSVEAPHELREEAWRRLARDLDVQLLDDMTSVVALEDARSTAERVLAGEVRGRTVVDLGA